MPNLEKETKDAIVKEAQTEANTKAQDKTYNDDDLNGGDNDTDEPNA